MLSLVEHGKSHGGESRDLNDRGSRNFVPVFGQNK